MILNIFSDCSAPCGLVAQRYWFQRHHNCLSLFWYPTWVTRFWWRTYQFRQVLSRQSSLFIRRLQKCVQNGMWSRTWSNLKSSNDNEYYQKWKGLFRSPFVLQTFAVHLGAIDGSVKVPDLHGSGSPTPVMAGALGLAAASVSTAHCLQGCSDHL
jgi:hypothetical protein